MSFLLRLCLGLAILAPSLAHAQSSLDVPSDGDKLSGIGTIHGWKCEAEGDITIVFYAGDPAGDPDATPTGDPIPATYGFPRDDTIKEEACGVDDDGNNGFYTFFNWALLDDGEHTAVAYDDDVEFARNTFTVTTTGEEFLRDASAQVTVEDFPSPGETTVLEWNQSTQHFEMVMRTSATDLGVCVEELTVGTEEKCSGSISITGSDINFTFVVDTDGQACISGGTPFDGCYPANLPDDLSELGVSITKNEDGSWTIDGLPLSEPVDLGTCKVGWIVNPGEMCSGSILGIGFTFSVDADGRGCVASPVLNQCYDTRLNEFGASARRNDDDSWTITDLP